MKRKLVSLLLALCLLLTLVPGVAQAAPGSYAVTVRSTAGGSATIPVGSAAPGQVIPVTILPDSGYRPQSITLQGAGSATAAVAYASSNIWNVTMGNGDLTIHVSFEKSDNPFMDVPDDSFYHDSVMWALETGVTTGTDWSHFDPDGLCLRAHVVTFLWRAAGCPEPWFDDNPFHDVSESDFFYTAVLWAVEQGITTGLSETEFGPYTQCNRAQVVTFLWRWQDSPAAGGAANPFTDVKAGQWYTDAVVWAVANGITNGLSAREFGVNTPGNRAQIVTFLYRADHLPEQEPTKPTDPVAPGDGIPPSDPVGTTYILNTSTKKFHYPDCFSVDKITAENYHEYVGSREKLLRYGYSPCGHCDP